MYRYSRIAILCDIQNTYVFIIPVLAYLVTALPQTPGAGVTLIKCYNAEKRQHQMGIYMYLGLITSGCFLVLSQPLSPVLTHSKKASKIVDKTLIKLFMSYRNWQGTRENTRSRHFHVWQRAQSDQKSSKRWTSICYNHCKLILLLWLTQVDEEH